MLRWMIGSGQRVRLLVVTLAVAVMALGAWQLPQTRQEMLPEFGPVYVEVQTEALGLSAEEVENLITVPLEQNMLNGVAWLEDIRSQSITGLSSIVLIFEPGTDPLRARQMVAERLTQTGGGALPAVSKPPTMLQPLSSASRVIMVRLSSTELTPIQTSVLARWTIRPALMGVPGVANVSIWGQRERQLQVQVDPEILHEHGIRLEDVIATTGNALWVSPLTYLEASAPGTGGFIDTPNQRIGVQHLLPIGSAEELALVPIEGCATSYSEQTADGGLVCPTLGDVAKVVEDHQPMIGDAVATENQDLLLVIEKFPDADTEAVTEGVQGMMADLAPGLTGVVIDDSVFERANLIDAAMNNMSQLLIVGLVIALVVLGVMLFDWRSALICAVAIPLSLVTAALILHLRDATFNTVIVAGLVVALGVIIDDVVIDVDNMMRRLRQHRDAGSDKSPTSILMEAAVETRGTALALSAVVVLAALPVLFLGGLFDAFFLGGQARTFFQPLVGSYVLAIAASLLISLLVTPTLAALLLARAPRDRRPSPILVWIQRQYGRLLTRTSPMYGLAGATAAVILAIGIGILPQLREPDSIIPPSQDRDLLVTWDAPSGTSLPEMTRITSRISAELKEVPGVVDVGAHVGRAILSDQVVDVNSGELWVSIEDDADYDATVSAVDEIVQGYPGLNHVVQTYLEDRIASVQSSTDDLVLRIYGQDTEVLKTSAEAAQVIANDIDGVTNARLDLQVQEPQVQVEVDLAAAQTYGLKPGEVRRTAATLVTGLEVGSLFQDQKVFEVMVVGVPDVRQSFSTVENILIDTPSGDQVRLGDVASVSLVPGFDSIKHDAVSRYVDVLINVDGRSNGAVVADLETRLANVEFPLEYHAEVLGEYAESADAQQALMRVTIATAVGIFLIMQAIFGSWRLASMTVLTVPTAMVGGLIAMLFRDDTVTLGAVIGFLALFVIAARHSVTLVSRYRRMEREDGIRPGMELVLRASQERVGPILMTSVATALAVAPFAVMNNIPGLEILHPMALVILGGLVTTTIVNLFVVPSLYLLLTAGTLPQPAATGAIPVGSPSAAAD
jgi:Cu/Ag efflux pump CusA